MRSKFKDEHPFEKRKAEADRTVPAFLGFDGRPVCLCDPQAHQAGSGEGHLYLCGRGSAPNGCIDECHLRGTQGRGRLLICLLLWREYLRIRAIAARLYDTSGTSRRRPANVIV
ncbi:hypothetical protein RSAG8_04750, partial [Rhizoctonia solani AG-8 WAC10335]